MDACTHGNRHRLTIEAQGKDGHQYSLDTAKAGKYEDEDWVVLASGGHPIGEHWDIIAVLIGGAFKAGLIQPKHVYRVPAWSKMPTKYRQALFNMFTHTCRNEQCQ